MKFKREYRIKGIMSKTQEGKENFYPQYRLTLGIFKFPWNRFYFRAYGYEKNRIDTFLSYFRTGSVEYMSNLHNAKIFIHKHIKFKENEPRVRKISKRVKIYAYDF